ncbi:iron-siderophore ABC transporter substrate-binding protein [Saccharopolyspora gloriosae]|uniref:Iron complex transport system substrate-binding protein n=1 Tax=Saccharopolyspora gloriosae TaxID=455344 RepID=A0A840NI23_9PSEU|nr:iron-siderophore ABC transporter substrate-binding protein [Saccharopolyspora gloriosae]MBB5068949.1 iron complex transport system substrate-binding protein [Saccharopolyspora gloriosae]
MPARPRGPVLATALLSAVLMLAGCSGGPSAAPDVPAGDADWTPVTVSTAFGEVTVPQRPQRVVTLGWGDAEVALALGVQPVGSADWLGVGGDGLGEWVQQRYEPEPPPMLGTLDVNMERLAGLAPDLILDTRASGAPDRYEQLSGLGVPVISIPEGARQYTTTWQQQLDLIGTALGERPKAQRLRADLEAKFARAAREHPEFVGATSVVGARTVRGFGAYVDGTSRVEFMRALGFRNSPAIQELAGTGFSVPISQERLDLLDADLTVMTTIGLDPQVLIDDPLYRAVPSVREGRDVVFTDDVVSSAFASATAVGIPYALDHLVPRLAEAVSR